MRFIAVLVTAIILISVSGLNPLAVGVAANIAAAYCAWRATATGSHKPSAPASTAGQGALPKAA
jgi:hypothetical protein